MVGAYRGKGVREVLGVGVLEMKKGGGDKTEGENECQYDGANDSHVVFSKPKPRVFPERLTGGDVGRLVHDLQRNINEVVDSGG